MSDYQSLIIKLNEAVESTGLSKEEKKALMDSYELMETGNMSMPEFSEDLIEAINLTIEKAPQVMPEMLAIASEIAKNKI